MCQGGTFKDLSPYLHTVRVVVENSDDTFLVACKDRQETVGKEEVCAGQASRMWVLPEDRQLVWVLLEAKCAQEEYFMNSDTANLETNKPDALDDVTNNQEVLHSSK